MADPFESLRLPDAPVAPSTSFAEDLRRRVHVALGITPPGGAMPTTAAKPSYQPAGYHSVVTYITVDDFEAARGFYESALGGRLSYDPIVMDDGRVGHAEMTFGDTVIMISEEFPELGVQSATTLGGSPFMLTYYVPDADATWRRAVDAGATPLRPVELQFYGARSGQIVDPFGLRWSISTQVEDEQERSTDA
jgi:PhnB protein